MPYSLNTNGAMPPAAEHSSGRENAGTPSTDTGGVTEPMKKMPPRVILHPNGRSHSGATPAGAQATGAQPCYGANKKLGTGPAAASAGTYSGGTGNSSRSNSPGLAATAPTLPSSGAAAAMHVMQSSSSHNALSATMLTAAASHHQPLHHQNASAYGAAAGQGGGDNGSGRQMVEMLKRTEEQMETLRRKLSAMHADIRQLTPSASPSNGSTTTTPVLQLPPLTALVGGTVGTSVAAKTSVTAVTPPASSNGNRGIAHHLSPLPAQPGKTAAAASASSAVAPPPQPAVSALKTGTRAASPEKAAVKPALAAPARGGATVKVMGERKLSLDDHGFLESPEDSSSDDDSSSSDSARSSDEEATSAGGGAGGRKKNAAGGGAAAGRAPVKPAGAPPAAAPGAAPARKGFGFKRADKPAAAAATGAPAAPAAGAAGAAAKSRGVHLFADATAAAADGAKAREKRHSGDSNSALSTSLMTSSLNGRGGGEGGEGRRPKLFMGDDTDAAAHDNAHAVDGFDNHSRRRTQAVTSLREHFLASVPRQHEVLGAAATDHEAVAAIRLPGTPCSWLCCISLAISFVTGVPTPVEKVLRTNHLGVHYLGLDAITLAQLYDLTHDYIHTRFHRTSCDADEFEEDEEAAQCLSEEELKLLPHVHCEMATLDTEVIDPVEESEASYGMGEHAPVTSLAQFRKELVAHNSDEKSLYIFNYDPYVIEEYETRLRANNAESEEEEAAIWANMLYKKGACRGAFGILVSFNPVQATATIVSPHMTKDQLPAREAAAGGAKESNEVSEGTQKKLARFGPVFSKLVLEEHTISLHTLYEATKQRDAYTQLSRGFVRVFVSEDFSPMVPSIFPLFVLDGSSAAGLMTTTLDVSVAPHVLGLAMMHHLSITFLLSDNARRKQSSRNLLNKANVCDVKLRGIPLTKIIQQLRLPVSMMVGHSNKESIAMAFAWYTGFLQQLQVSSDVRLGLVRPARRGGADDGQANIEEEEFLAHLRTAVTTESVLLISFDVNVALNVRINCDPEPAHFAIVIGLDEERGIVRLADVNVKRFRKTWHIPFYRLYNAVMGYGYMMAAKDKRTIKALGGKKAREEALGCGRYALPPVPKNAVTRFEYPAKAYALTVLADAVNRLGFPSDVERFLNFSGFHISYFLSKHLPLEGAAVVVQNYSHYALDDALSVVTKHYDYTVHGAPPVVTTTALASPTKAAALMEAHHVRTEEELLEDVQHALASPQTRQLIVKFDPVVIAEDTQVFNGSSQGGCFAIVVDYDAMSKSVILSNADPVKFYRTFAVPLPLLFHAISTWDPEDMRARGTMLLTKEYSQEGLYDNTKGYDFAHALVHHPFRPVFSASCSCLALAATELMMNIEAPTMLGGAPLAIEDEEKRKYKRYNNIFSAEDILYALPSFSVHEWQSNSTKLQSEDVAVSANAAFKQLGLPLVAVDVTRGDSAGTQTTSGSSPDGTNALTDPTAFLHACNGVSGLLTITLLAYDTDKMYGVPGSSMGVVNRVEIFDEDDEDEDGDDAPSLTARKAKAAARGDCKGAVQLLEGEPSRWGAVSERFAEELMPCVTAILCIMEVEGDEDDESRR